jgi:hypothetical protein
MKRTIVILAGLLLLSNIFWSAVYFGNKKKLEDDMSVVLYTLNGSGQLWDVKNHNIVITPDSIIRGHSELIFKGDPEQIEDSKYFSYTFIETNHKNEQGVVLTSETQSNDGPISILSNLNVGSISDSYSYDETRKSKSNYESTVVEILWNDKSGETKRELVELNITSETRY